MSWADFVSRQTVESAFFFGMAVGILVMGAVFFIRETLLRF